MTNGEFLPKGDVPAVSESERLAQLKGILNGVVIMPDEQESLAPSPVEADITQQEVPESENPYIGLDTLALEFQKASLKQRMTKIMNDEPAYVKYALARQKLKEEQADSKKSGKVNKSKIQSLESEIRSIERQAAFTMVQRRLAPMRRLYTLMADALDAKRAQDQQ